MINQKTFCEKCRCDVRYTVEKINLEGVLKGKRYEYVGEKATCTSCGSEVFVHGIEDFNLEALCDTYGKTK